METDEIGFLAAFAALYLYAGRQAFLLFMILDGRARSWGWLARYRDAPYDGSFHLLVWLVMLTWPLLLMIDGLLQRGRRLRAHRRR